MDDSKMEEGLLKNNEDTGNKMQSLWKRLIDCYGLITRGTNRSERAPPLGEKDTATTGISKVDSSSLSKTEGKRVLEATDTAGAGKSGNNDGGLKNKKEQKEVPKLGPVIDKRALDRLDELEGRSGTLHMDHKALREEADGHIRHSSEKLSMLLSAVVPGSLGVGVVKCGVALEVALVVLGMLIITVVPVFVQAWIRFLGCLPRITFTRKEQANLIVRLVDLKTYFEDSADESSTVSPDQNSVDQVSVSGFKCPPPSPEKHTAVEFHRRLDKAIGTTKSDIDDNQWSNYIYLSGLTLFGILCCAAMALLLYHGVCPGNKNENKPAPPPESYMH